MEVEGEAEKKDGRMEGDMSRRVWGGLYMEKSREETGASRILCE